MPVPFNALMEEYCRRQTEPEQELREASNSKDQIKHTWACLVKLNYELTQMKPLFDSLQSVRAAGLDADEEMFNGVRVGNGISCYMMFVQELQKTVQFLENSFFKLHHGLRDD